MYTNRGFATASMFDGNNDLWWVTGGRDDDNDAFQSTEMYSEAANGFTFGSDLPKPLKHHSLVNVNRTHMVVLGGQDRSDEVFIYNR